MFPRSGSSGEIKYSSSTRELDDKVGNQEGSLGKQSKSSPAVSQLSSRMQVIRSSGELAAHGRVNKTGMQSHGSDFDMRSGNFDPRSYVKRLIQTKESMSLLKLDDEMVRSTKKLDSDIRMLVYENYNKFIEATDTIRKMKQNVEAMESDIKKLDESICTVSTASNSINAILQDKRVRMDKLVRVRRLLHRLQFLFELPDRLTDALEMGSVSQAIEYYTTTRETLRAHSHVSSFDVIAQESNTIMNSLRLRLNSSIQGDPNTISQSDFIESVSYLIRLGAPVSSLVERYVSYHRELVEGWLASSRRAVADDPSSFLDFTMGQLAKGFLPLLVRTKTAFDRLFGPIESKEEGGLNDTENNDRGEYLSDSLMKGKRDLLLFLSNCANSFFELLERGLLPIANSEEDITDMAIDDVGLLSTVATLEHFFFDVKRVDSAIGGVGLTSRCASFVKGAKHCRMKVFFEAMKVSVLKNTSSLASLANNGLEFHHLKEVQNTAKRLTGYQVLVQDAVDKISAAIERAVTESVPLLKGGGSGDQEYLVEQLHLNVWHFMCWFMRCLFAFSGVPNATVLPVRDNNGKGCLLQQEVEKMMGLKEEELTWPSIQPPLPRVVLILACVCCKSGKQLVPAAAEVQARHTSPYGQNLKVGKHDEIVRAHFDSGSQSILSHYIEMVGGDLASLWEVGIDAAAPSISFAQMENFPLLLHEPVLRVLAGLDVAAADVSAVLGEILGGRGGKEGYVRALGASTIGGMGAGTMKRTSLTGFNRDLQLNIDRIFASEIVVMGGHVKFTADEILGTVLKVICKAIEQDLRRAILSKEGFQQVQVDVEVLQLAASAYVMDISVVSDIQSLLDAMMVAADDRSVEVIPMQHVDALGLAESILTKHLNQDDKGD